MMRLFQRSTSTPRPTRATRCAQLAALAAALTLVVGCGGNESAAPQDALETADSTPQPADSAGDVSTGDANPDATTDAGWQAQCLDPLTQAPLADGAACDDGRACTQGDVCKAGVCTSGVQTCACEPGFLDCAAPSAADASNKCKGAPYCQAQAAQAPSPFACIPNPGQTKVCDTSLDSACVKNACAPASGACAPTAVERTTEVCDLPAGSDDKAGCRIEVKATDLPDNEAVACDDGLSCTSGELCANSVCAAADQSGCTCKADADCVDDGDLCNGTPYCDKSGAVWACEVNPSTIVTCDTSTDSGCLQTSCAPKTGVCTKASKAAGTACDDGVACTVGDVCTDAGTCEPGTWTCCKSDADCANQEDGDLCNGTLFCDKAAGTCKLNPTTIVSCPSAGDTECAKSTCTKASGLCALQPVSEGKGCDDGQPCTAGEVCTQGKCQGGTDTCPCSVDADCVAKDDGDLCNGTLYCNKALGQCKPNPKTVVVCPSANDTDCMVNTCGKITGLCAMQPLAANTPCDADGTACTAGDACDGQGACKVGTAVCECQSDVDCVGKDDGNLCNGVLYCDASGPFVSSPHCMLNPATVKSCPSVDDTACSKNQCQPKTGLCVVTTQKAGVPCDDGEPCTAGDACDAQAACKPGAAQGCGCKVDGDCAMFDDGDVCNGGYTCKSGTCVADAKPLTCDDKQSCTADSCDKVAGCVHKATNDGAACNEVTNGVCNAGVCQAPACPPGHDVVAIDNGGVKASVCVAYEPVWGARPDKPVAVYTVSEPVAGAGKVVVDSQTKLMWQQATGPSKTTWLNAVKHCDDSSVAGYEDWRLPSSVELETLVDYSIAVPGPTIDQAVFPGTKAGNYWTATVRANPNTYAWTVNFQVGYVSTTGKTFAIDVRCVRGN